MSTKFYVTRHGYNQLVKKIAALETRLKQTQLGVGEAADVGGNQWHDNASYEQLVIDIRGQDKRLVDVHNVLNNSTVVDQPSSTDKVVIGTIARILVDGVTKESWGIVGYDESNLDRNLIAYNTPLAKLLCGMKCMGERVGTITDRKVKVKIVSIEIMTDKDYETGVEI